MNSKRKDVLWIIILRLIIATSLFVAAIVIQYSTSVFLLIGSFYYLIFFVYMLTLIYLILYFWKKYYTFQIYLQIFFDLLLITALVYISGGLSGSFYILYIFAIIAASIVLSSRAAYLIAAFSAIFFALLVDGMYFGIIPYLSSDQSMEISAGVLTSSILIACSVFFIIAFLTNYLTSSLRKAREELSLVQKELDIKKRLAIAGEVAAQLAHEIRNPLAAISGSIQVLKEELSPGEEQRKLMDIIIKESNRASQSIEQLLDLASPPKRTLSSINLSDIVKETLVLLQRSGEMNGNYSAGGNYQLNKVDYFGNSNQFKQLFWNLIKNALKAMPYGGTLKIDLHQGKKGEVQIRLADSGTGISEEDKKRVFEPFYSRFREGDGIGMAVVNRIVDEYKGRIRLNSEKNKGTEVIITLPLSAPLSS